MNARVLSFTLDTTGDNGSEDFGVKAQQQLSGEYSVSASGSPNGSIHLRRWNTLTAAWEMVADADTEFTAVAGSAVSGTFNIVNVPQGRCQFYFDHDSGTGAADGLTIKARIDDRG